MPNMTDKSPNISQFVEKIRYDGVSKTARYYVELSLPNVVSGNYTGKDLNMINLYVEQTMFPEFVIATQQTRSHSNPVEMPYDRIFGPVTMTLLCDRKMTVKHFFDMWIQGIYGSFGGVLNYYDDYVVPEINIYKLDEQNTKMYCVTLYNAFPKVVNDVMLASGSNDLSRFQVVFSYEMWKSFVIEGPGYDMAKDIFGPPDLRAEFGPVDYRSGSVIGSMPDIPGIDFINGLLQSNQGGAIQTIKTAMGISTGLDILNKLKNPELLRDSLRRSARSFGTEILKSTKSQVLNSLPKSVKQIGGSVLGRVGGALGL